MCTLPTHEACQGQVSLPTQQSKGAGVLLPNVVFPKIYAEARPEI